MTEREVEIVEQRRIKGLDLSAMRNNARRRTGSGRTAAGLWKVLLTAVLTFLIGVFA